MNITKFNFIILLIICLSLTFISNCTKTNHPEDIVIAYKDAINARDVDSIVSFYTEDAVFNIPSLRMYITGIDTLRGVSEYDSVLNTKMELTNIQTNFDTVSCSIRDTNDWMKAVGISAAFYPRVFFVIKNEKIKYIEAEMADSSIENFQEVLSAFMPWAAENHPHVWDSMMVGGNFNFNAQNGVRYLELLKKWREDQSSSSIQ